MSTAPFYFLGLVLNCVIFSSDTGPLQSALITYLLLIGNVWLFVAAACTNGPQTGQACILCTCLPDCSLYVLHWLPELSNHLVRLCSMHRQHGVCYILGKVGSCKGWRATWNEWGTTWPGPFMVYILPIVDYGMVLCKNDVSTAVVCFAFNFLIVFVLIRSPCIVWALRLLRGTDLIPTWWVMFAVHRLYCTGDHIAGCAMDWTLLFFADFWCDTRWSRGFLPHSIWIHFQDGRHSCFYYTWNLSIP